MGIDLKLSFKCKIRKLLAIHVRAWQVRIPLILVKAKKKKKKEKIHKKEINTTVINKNER